MRSLRASTMSLYDASAISRGVWEWLNQNGRRSFGSRLRRTVIPLTKVWFDADDLAERFRQSLRAEASQRGAHTVHLPPRRLGQIADRDTAWLLEKSDNCSLFVDKAGAAGARTLSARDDAAFADRFCAGEVPIYGPSCAPS